MKRIMILSTAALLISGVVFANGKDKEKGKDKPKKEKTVKSCPGKECSKKK